MLTTRRTILPLAALTIFTAACGASAKDAAYPDAAAPRAAQATASAPTMAEGMAAAPRSAAASAPSAPSATPRAPTGAKSAADTDAKRAAPMLVYTGQLTMEADEPALAKVMDQVVDVAESFGGHISARSDRSVTVKVPSSHFREALTKLESVSTVTSRSVSAEDVTEEFADLEVRLANLKATRQRLQEFLARAVNVQDALTVERELERIAQDIDRIEGRLHFLKERSSFSTITVAVVPKPKPALAVVEKPREPPPPPPRRVLDLPVSWFDDLGVERLLRLR